jgi:hypothetical protein
MGQALPAWTFGGHGTGIALPAGNEIPGLPQSWPDGFPFPSAGLTVPGRPQGRPRTSRDAGPYLEAMGRADRPRSAGYRIGASIGSTADQQGRWSLPGGMMYRGRADRPRSAGYRIGASIGSTADQQGRWSLPGGRRRSRRLGVGGWRLDEAAPGTLDSALDAALCTLYSVSFR